MSDLINPKQYISDLEKTLEDLEAQLTHIEDKRDEIYEKLELAQMFFQDYFKHYNLGEPEPIVNPKLQSKFQNLTIKEALIKIASENNNILDTFEARETLVRAGVFKDDTNASNSIYPILSKSKDEFTRTTKRGVYTLVQTDKPFKKVSNGFELTDDDLPF